MRHWNAPKGASTLGAANHSFLPPQWEEAHSRERGSKTSRPRAAPFIAYVPVQFVGYQICSTLGTSAVLNELYSKVVSEWALPSDVLTQLIYERHFDLLQLRPHEIDQVNRQLGDMYRNVAHYP